MNDIQKHPGRDSGRDQSRPGHDPHHLVCFPRLPLKVPARRPFLQRSLGVKAGEARELRRELQVAPAAARRRPGGGGRARLCTRCALTRRFVCDSRIAGQRAPRKTKLVERTSGSRAAATAGRCGATLAPPAPFCALARLRPAPAGEPSVFY